MNILLPEWTEIDAVILAWPHEQTDWAPWIEQVSVTYIALINAINASDAAVILLCRQQDCEQIKSLLNAKNNVLLVVADYNDTWVRDYGFLTHQLNDDRTPIEFTFNGWGNKFDASKDNQVNQKSS